MLFSIGHVLEYLDQTALNPWATGLLTLSTHLFTRYGSAISGLGKWHDYDLARIQSLVMKLAVAGAIIRINRVLTSRALNNGVKTRFNWATEIIVVTGGAGGIGAKTVQKLASRGSQIVVIDVLPLTYPKPSNVHYYSCDLTDYDAVIKTSALIQKEIGHPTCVIANAGICRGKPILEAGKRDIELTFGVNNLGLLWTAKAFLPNMATQNRGHFLIIASQTSHLATAGVVDYAATKAAALAIYEGLHTELKHVYKAPGVRVSAVSPSAVSTKMFDGIKAPSNFFLPRLEPQDVADSICDILWSGKAQNIMIPAFAYISTTSRSIPDWLRVGMQDGGADVMTELKPHKPVN